MMITDIPGIGDAIAPIDLVAEMGAEATAEAIRAAVRHSKPIQ